MFSEAISASKVDDTSRIAWTLSKVYRWQWNCKSIVMTNSRDAEQCKHIQHEMIAGDSTSVARTNFEQRITRTRFGPSRLMRADDYVQLGGFDLLLSKNPFVPSAKELQARIDLTPLRKGFAKSVDCNEIAEIISAWYGSTFRIQRSKQVAHCISFCCCHRD